MRTALQIGKIQKNPPLKKVKENLQKGIYIARTRSSSRMKRLCSVFMVSERKVINQKYLVKVLNLR
jgi:hypothetical protein